MNIKLKVSVVLVSAYLYSDRDNYFIIIDLWVITTVCVCVWSLHCLVEAHCSRHFWNSDSGWSFPRFKILEPPDSADGISSSSAAGINFGSIPGKVGRKNGACFGCLGGSIGLFRCLITSRFCKLCHRDFGRAERVTSPSDSGAVFSSEWSSANSLAKSWDSEPLVSITNAPSFLCSLSSVSTSTIALVGSSVNEGVWFGGSGQSETWE